MKGTGEILKHDIKVLQNHTGRRTVTGCRESKQQNRGHTFSSLSRTVHYGLLAHERCIIKNRKVVRQLEKPSVRPKNVAVVGGRRAAFLRWSCANAKEVISPGISIGKKACMGSCCKRREGMDTHCEHMSKSVQRRTHTHRVSERTCSQTS